MTKVLALDISKNRTGWAVDETPGRPVCGSWSGAKDMTPGRAGSLYAEWLVKMIKKHEPDVVALEAPLMGSRNRAVKHNFDTSYILVGLAFMSEAVAASFRLVPKKAHVATVRKNFLGHGYPPDPKEAVMARCRLLGWDVPNHDAADAAAVWAWAKATHDKSFRYETATPLFAKGAA